MCTVALWVSAAEVLQWVMGAGGFTHPHLGTVVCASGFVVLLLPAVAGSGAPAARAALVAAVRQDWHLAVLFAACWIGANALYNTAITYTTVASATAVSSLSSATTLAAGSLLGLETPTASKCASVIFSIAGVSVITRADGRGASASASDGAAARPAMHGDVLAMLSALLYTMYLITFNRFVGDRIPLTTFLGMVGIVAVLLLGPVWALSGVPLPTRPQLAGLVFNAVLGTALSQLLWLYGAKRCGATAATLALALAIPVSAAIDILRGSLSMTPVWAVGALFIVAAFAAVARESGAEQAPVASPAERQRCEGGRVIVAG